MNKYPRPRSRINPDAITGNPITVRIPPPELALIRKAAVGKGVGTSTYIREAAIDTAAEQLAQNTDGKKK